MSVWIEVLPKEKCLAIEDIVFGKNPDVQDDKRLNGLPDYIFDNCWKVKDILGLYEILVENDTPHVFLVPAYCVKNVMKSNSEIKERES